MKIGFIIIGLFVIAWALFMAIMTVRGDGLISNNDDEPDEDL